MKVDTKPPDSIVRKIVILDVEGKLDRAISTIMSRPVDFVRASHLEEDLKHLSLPQAEGRALRNPGN